MILQEYEYQINAAWLMGGKRVDFKPETIHHVTVNREYDTKNMPITLMQVSIPVNICNEMIKNKNNSTIILDIKKYKKANMVFLEQYIEGEFTFFICDDVLLDSSVREDTSSIFKVTTLGLMKLDLITKNKKVLNCVIKDASNMEIACYATQHIPMIIEQMAPYKWKELLIPPVETLSALFEYLNYRYCLYTTPYRYFLDFNRGYLLSSAGAKLTIKGETIGTVMISVQDTKSDMAKLQGMTVDNTAKAYMINIDASEYSVYTDNTSDLSYNKIVAVTSTGDRKELTINTNKVINTSEKVKYIQVAGDNLLLADNLKAKQELMNVIIEIQKANIDNSIFTIDKVYHIKNIEAYKSNDGFYILSRRIESFIRNGEVFNCNCALQFRKKPN